MLSGFHKNTENGKNLIKKLVSISVLSTYYEMRNTYICICIIIVISNCFLPGFFLSKFVRN